MVAVCISSSLAVFVLFRQSYNIPGQNWLQAIIWYRWKGNFMVNHHASCPIDPSSGNMLQKSDRPFRRTLAAMLVMQ